jgi:hypothetical protein
MVFDTSLLFNFGAIGIFCAYLIYHDQKVNDGIVESQKEQTKAIQAMTLKMVEICTVINERTCIAKRKK